MEPPKANLFEKGVDFVDEIREIYNYNGGYEQKNQRICPISKGNA